MTPLGALEATGLGVAMREWPWLYPAVALAHLVAGALLFGAIAVLDLRLLGFGRALSARRLAAHVLPWGAASLLVIVPSGLALFTAHASELIDSRVFVLKMALILTAAVNAGLFHTTVFRSAAVWDAEEMRSLPPPPSVRAFAAASLALWAAVLACGGLLAGSSAG